MDRYAKAVVGALTGLLYALVTALTDGQITATEWVIGALAAVSAAGAVWATPNAPAKGNTDGN